MADARGETAAVNVDGKIYVLGDYNSSPINNRFEVYDPATDTWTLLPDIPTGRGQAAAAEVDGVIYYIGGNNCFWNCWLTVVEAYDTHTGTWRTDIAPLPGEGRGMLSAVAVNGKIYAMGGGNSYIVPTFSYNHVYDPASNTWTDGPPLPRARSHHGAAVLDGRIYLVGGIARQEHGCSNQYRVAEVDVFDPTTGAWSAAAPLPIPVYENAVVAFGGRIYSIGGRSMLGDWTCDNTGSRALVQEYDPALDCWRVVTSLPIATRLCSAAVAAGRIYVFGGRNDQQQVTLADVFQGVPRALPGDMDGDGDVDLTDLSIVLANFGTNVP